MPTDSAPQIPLVQAGFFRPVLTTLEQAGANIESLLRDSSLNRFDLCGTENYVPVRRMYNLFELIKQREAIADFFAVFGRQLALQSLSDWGATVAFTPDVLSACQFAVRFDNVVLTHERMVLEIMGPVSKLSQYFRDQPQPGREFADYVDFCYMLNGVRLGGGAAWEPIEIHLQSQTAPDFEYLLPLNRDTRVYLGQPMTSVVFPTAMLNRSMLGTDLNRSDTAIDEIPQTLPQVIEELLSASQRAQVAHLDVIAELLDLSPRTLRRRLSEAGTSFTKVVENWRFKACLNLLEQENLRIGEIGEQLGYANTPNFERAFKRWTGQSPSLYRDQL